jgi:hypothetical protein
MYVALTHHAYDVQLLSRCKLLNVGDPSHRRRPQTPRRLPRNATESRITQARLSCLCPTGQGLRQRRDYLIKRHGVESEEVEEGSEMNLDDIKERLKKLEVFADGRPVRIWEPVAVGDYPRFWVESKAGAWLWGEELFQAIIDTQETFTVEKPVIADMVVAEWKDGRIEVITEGETKTFTSREGWQTYWRSLDEWPEEIDADDPDKPE